MGNVNRFADTTYNGGPGVMGSWSITGPGGTSGYDTLNRLATGHATSGTYNGQYACWSYDSFGNRLQQEISSAAFQAGSGGASACQPQSSASVTTDLATYSSINQITSTNARGVTATPAYDLAGNMTSDGVNSYLYDGEGRICAVESTPLPGNSAITGYIYNAEGQRVAKGTLTTLSCNLSTNGFQLTESYVLGQGGEELTMLDGNSHWQRTNVYGAGQLLATYDVVAASNTTGDDGSGSTETGIGIAALHFQITNPLGTRRMQTSAAGVPETDCQSLPFGDEQFCFPDPNAPVTTDDATPLHFTGKERDAESGNDYFGARYYASSMGRFMSPDYSADPDPVPYADFDDPQSLNLYAYVDNNPLKSVDSEGHYSCDPDTWGSSTNTLTAGACHLDWGDFRQYINSQLDYYKQATSQVANSVSQAANTFGNIMNTPGGANCMGALGAGGATAGGIAGGGVGLAGLAGGGVAVVVTEPAGLVAGGIGGGASGVALGMTMCPGGAASGGGGRASGSSARLTKPQQKQTAKYLGMKEVKGLTSQGQPVFEKDGRYFSFSNTSHTADEVFKEVDRSGNRIATTDLNLNRIGP
ncbi:MAG TPA: RHS repeat-associated core domain-containing protein [Terracidiphilus sp.]|nr:RHS repeat-associated core domain-containing protein [Terracidiphilus sp.]